MYENFIALDITIIILQTTCGICNGVILSIFFGNSTLYRNENLRLLAYVGLFDFGFSIFSYPYTIYLTAFWNSSQLNYNPWYLMFASIPLLIHVKASLILTMAIALDRILGIFTPTLYRKFDHGKFANLSFLMSFIFGVVDIILLFSLTEVQPHAGCAAAGCIYGSNFTKYWATSNMILGILVIIFIFSIFYGLKKLQRLHNTSRVSNDRRRFDKANRTIAGILIATLICITAPSAIMGTVELLGYPVFRVVGPFISVGMLISGICNSIIFIQTNTEARNSLPFLKKKVSSSITVSSQAKRSFAVVS